MDRRLCATSMADEPSPGADEGLVLVVGSTSHPDTLRRAFVQPGRLERVVEVTPVFPRDIVETLTIHAAIAEKKAGRPLFDQVDWNFVSGEAAGEVSTPISTADLQDQVVRFKHVNARLPVTRLGTYV